MHAGDWLQKVSGLPAEALAKVGGRYRTRTCDLLLVRQTAEKFIPLTDQEVTENREDVLAVCFAFLNENLPDLALVVKCWDNFPEAIKNAILALARQS